jgi:hydroxymethylbilane synthase
MADQQVLRIGTRGSPLALTQTRMVRERLIAAHPRLAEPGATEIVAIKTTGDRVQDVVLSAIGGKGLFTKELDEALLDGRIDLAIHSMKDVPTFLPDGMVLTTLLPREDVRDAFLSNRYKSFAELPDKAVVGTASTRRRAQILARRPDLIVEPLRGNVETRIAKLAEGGMAATFLAYAGLKRLGKADAAREVMAVETILPAVGQGALAATFRAADARVRALLLSLVDPETEAAVWAERAMLAILDGSCQTPIAAYGSLDRAKTLTLKGMIAHPSGIQIVEAEASGPPAEADQLGVRVANELLFKAGPALLRAIKGEQPKIYRVPTDDPSGRA